MIAPKTGINCIVSSAAGHTAILIKGKLRGLRVLVISAGTVVARVPAPPGQALPRLTHPGLVFAGLVLPVILAFTFSLAGCYWTEESPEGGISLRIAVPENRFSSREEQPAGTDAGVLTATVVNDGMLRSDREIALRFFADLEAETDRSAALLEEMEGGDGIDAASRGSTPMRLDLPYPATQFQGVAVSYGPDAATTGTTTFSGLNGGSRYLIVVRVRTDETALVGYAVVGVRAGESRTVTLEPTHDPDDPDSAFSRFLSDRYGLEPETTDPEGLEGPEGPVYYDTFEDGFNTEFLVYDGDHAAPYVESGLMVIPADKSLLYTRKFTLPVVIEGRGRLSASGTSYPKLGVHRIPEDYDADCLTRMIYIETRWDMNTILSIDRGYWVDPDNTDREKLPTPELNAHSFDFRMEIHPGHQLILINDTVYYDETHPLGGNHWWTFTIANWFATTTSELEWLRVTPAEFGDFEGVLPPP